MATVEANGPAYEFVWNELLYYERGSDIRAASHARAGSERGSGTILEQNTCIIDANFLDEAQERARERCAAARTRFPTVVNTGELMRPRGSRFFGVRRLTQKQTPVSLHA